MNTNIIFTNCGSVELVQENLDVDFICNVARTCKHGESVPRKTPEENNRFAAALWKAGHGSVFEFADCVYKVKAPIFVARQLMRYRTGKYCEKSLRSTAVERRKEENDVYDSHYNACVDFYKALIAQGVKREEARRVLPLDSPTCYFFKIDARNLLHLLEERTSHAAQFETRETAEAMKQLIILNNPRFAEVVGLC